MGRVFMKLRIMPKDVDVDLEALKDAVNAVKPEKVEIADFGIQPIAFGLRALLVAAVMPDEEGIGDRLIEEIQKIDDVESVEIEAQELI